jgi:hypothetical protein
MHRRGPYRGGQRAITRAGGWWVSLHRGILSSVRAKNGENWREYHDLLDAMEE